MPAFVGANTGHKFGWTYFDYLFAGITIVVAASCVVAMQRQVRKPGLSDNLERLFAVRSLYGDGLQCAVAVVLVSLTHSGEVAPLHPAKLPIGLLRLGLLIWCVNLTFRTVGNSCNSGVRPFDRALALVSVANLGLALGYCLFKPIMYFD
ncbi:MAG: hypothetical protein J0M17_00345 [Planctomycetes bacterium]|nr:hypothetical protein [Planctomycetota bacterium]